MGGNKNPGANDPYWFVSNVNFSTGMLAIIHFSRAATLRIRKCSLIRQSEMDFYNSEKLSCLDAHYVGLIFLH